MAPAQQQPTTSYRKDSSFQLSSLTSKQEATTIPFRLVIFLELSF